MFAFIIAALLMSIPVISQLVASHLKHNQKLEILSLHEQQIKWATTARTSTSKSKLLDYEIFHLMYSILMCERAQQIPGGGLHCWS